MAVLPELLSVYAVLIYAIHSVVSLKLPSGLNAELYCAGCQAVVTELNHILQRKSSESLEVRVEDALEDICDLQNFRKFEHPPTKMSRACKYLLEEYDEDMEQVLINHARSRESSAALEKRICHMMSGACLGLRTAKKEDDPKKIRDEEKLFNIDIGPNAKIAKPVTEKRKVEL